MPLRQVVFGMYAEKLRQGARGIQTGYWPPAARFPNLTFLLPSTDIALPSTFLVLNLLYSLKNNRRKQTASEYLGMSAKNG